MTAPTSPKKGTVSHLDPVLTDICRGGKWEMFKSNPEQFVQSYRLAPEEADALLTADFPRLYDLGAHPMLLLYYSRALGLPMHEYLDRINRRDGGQAKGEGILS